MPRQQTLHEVFGGAKTRKASGRAKGSPSPSQRTRRYRHATPDDSSSSASDSDDNVQAIQFESTSEGAAESSEDSEPNVPSPLKSTTKTRRAPATPPSPGSQSDLSEQSEEEELPAFNSTRKSIKRVLVDSDQSDEKPKRRRLVRGKGRATSSEDEEDLLEEIDSDQILESRLRGPSKKSAFSSKLDDLKRLRTGQKAERRPKPEPEHIEVLDSADEEEGSDSNIETIDKSKPFAGAKPDGQEVSDDEEEDDDDGFVVEDDADGVAVDLPAQFSRQSHQDLSMHFKVVCQLFVLLGCQPEPERESFMRNARSDEYFRLSLTALDRKLGSLRDSLVRSSVWKGPFTKALNTYPELELFDMDFVVPGCDACNMGGRASKIRARVSGRPYDFRSLQTKGLPNDDSDDDQDEGDEGEDPREFNLGRFCAARGRVYHDYCHWEYKLYTTLQAEIDQLQPKRRKGNKRDTFVKIKWSNNAEPPKDVTDGNEVMAWLDKRGIIQSEWHKIKKLMDGAHHLDAQRNAIDDDIL